MLPRSFEKSYWPQTFECVYVSVDSLLIITSDLSSVDPCQFCKPIAQIAAVIPAGSFLLFWYEAKNNFI